MWQAVGRAVIPGSLIVIRSVYDYHGLRWFRTGSAVAGVAGCGAGGRQVDRTGRVEGGRPVLLPVRYPVSQVGSLFHSADIQSSE